MPGFLKLILLVVIVSVGCNLLLYELARVVSHRTAALITGFAFLVAWVVGIGMVVFESAQGSLFFFRMYIAILGGMAIFVLPIAILPHPAMIVLGAIAAIAFASFIAAGKIHWLHRD